MSKFGNRINIYYLLFILFNKPTVDEVIRACYQQDLMI
jgi:hypothetical protein